MKKFISLILTAALAAASVPTAVIAEDNAATTTVSYKYGENAYERQMEKLDRGLIAINTGNGIYLGWRLLGDESSVATIKDAPGFDVYRNGEKLATVTDSTNYLDASGKSTDSYSVAIEGGEQCGAVSVQSNSYFDIPVDVPDAFVLDEETTYSYSIGDASTGDLDGDGQYELVVKWDCNPKDNSHSGVTGNVYLDAYELDGTMLWRIDLGRNIRSGAHYTQFIVYDLDLDGKAEITAKTAPGSIDGKGAYVTEASSSTAIKNADNSAVYVNDGGYILEGDEYFTAFDGETGAALDTIYYPIQRISASVWGDAYGNRVDRFVADVAYLDGEKPYAVYWRGYYTGSSGARMGVFGATLDENRKLQCNYCFDTYDTSSISGYKGVNGYTAGNEVYVGQGNHNMSVADVDNDGKDELFSGALCLEADSSKKMQVKWCTFRGHGDALHVGDYDPTHDGMEFFAVHEGGGYVDGTTGKTLDYGMTVIDAETGEELFHESASSDTGRGMMANVGAGGYYQMTSARTSTFIAHGNGEFTTANLGMSMNFRIFWDADIYDELLDGTNVTSWDGSTMSRIFSADGCVRVNGTKANPALQADLFGDWREELCYPTEDNTAIRVYTTTDVTTYKLPTLMHDPVYRSGVAAEQSAYNQPPHIGFYLADEIYRAALVGIDVIAPTKTDYVIGDTLDLEGMAVTASYEDGTNYDITGYSVVGFDSMSAGEQTITVSYMGYEKTFTVNVATPFECNSEGYITGYNGTAETAIIPETIDGIEVIGIAEGALDDAPIKKLYAYENIEYVERNSFSGTIYCYEGSPVHVYALENDIVFELIERESYNYLINVTFDEDAYNDFGMWQSNSSQTQAVGSISYTVGGRRQGGDGNTGFTIATDGDNDYLCGGVGRFSSNRRNASIALTDVPMLSAGSDAVLSFDFMIPYTTNSADIQTAAYISIEDSSGVVDTVSINNLGVETDKWYGYSLIYHGEKYYRVLTDSDDTLISITPLGAAGSDTAVSSLRFYRDEAYGNLGNGIRTYVALDNIEVYTSEAALSNVYVNVKDENGNPVEEAVVTIAGLSEKTDMDGYAQFLLPFGIYSTTIKAEGFFDKVVSTAAYRAEVTKKVAMELIRVPAEGVELRESAAVAIGKTTELSAQVIPSNSTETDFVWSSDNEAVATVENGVVKGVSKGTANITVSIGGYSAVCAVTVYDISEYEQIPTTVEISGGADSAYIPLSGTNSKVEFNATVCDQNGVEIENAKVEWSCDKVGISDGILAITASARTGTATVTAACGAISAQTTIELVSIINGADIYAELDYSEASSLAIRQGTEEVTSTIGDVTYGVHPRSNGGDGATGIYAVKDGDNTYLSMNISRFGASGRNPYMIFDKAPDTYETGKEYVFETDVYFESSSTMSLTLSNNVLISLMATPGMEADKWYHYVLTYSEGEYTQYVYDENGVLVSISTPVSGIASPITEIDYVGSDGDTLMIDNTRYYSKENAVSKFTIKVVDLEGAEVSGADVTIGSVTNQTDARGRAIYNLPIGVYNVSVSANGLEAMTSDVVLNGENQVLTVVYDESLLPTPEPTIPNELYYIDAKEADGELSVSIKALSTADRNSKTIYAAFYKDGRLLSVESYTKARLTLATSFTVPAEADSYTCMAWDEANEPIAISVKGEL